MMKLKDVYESVMKEQTPYPSGVNTPDAKSYFDSIWRSKGSPARGSQEYEFAVGEFHRTYAPPGGKRQSYGPTGHTIATSSGEWGQPHKTTRSFIT
jgi:hypothetical protein